MTRRWTASLCLAHAIGCSASEPTSASSNAPPTAASQLAGEAESSIAPGPTGSDERAAQVETGDPSAKPAASINVADFADATPRMLLTKTPPGNLGVLSKMSKEYSDCWKTEMTRPNGPTKGRGKISVTLKPDGSLSSVAVTGFENSKSFTSCITAVVRAGKFLPPSEGDSKLAFNLEFMSAL